MKKEWADKWVAALRSGKYKQGRYKLRVLDEYCCLGVLCEIVGVEAEQCDTTGPFCYGKERYTGDLPIEVMLETGVITKTGSYGRRASLAHENDEGKSFSKIADIIEKHWEDL